MLCGQLAQTMQGEGISRGQQDISQREQLDGQVDDIEGADGNSDDDMRMMIKNYITKVSHTNRIRLIGLNRYVLGKVFLSFSFCKVIKSQNTNVF